MNNRLKKVYDKVLSGESDNNILFNGFIVRELDSCTLRQIRIRRMPDIPIEFVCMIS